MIRKSWPGWSLFTAESAELKKKQRKRLILIKSLSSRFCFTLLLEIRLMEANYTYDEVVGTVIFDIAELRRNAVQKRTFVFNEVIVLWK